MPRKKRRWYPGATYHVMSRGNRRLAIFKETSDYHEFLKCLAMTKETCAFTIHALCLMTNHFHMCIETEDVEIWKIMHRLLLTYAANYNIKYKLTGHLFENRYIGQLIEDDRYFLEVSRYIHLNPVKAGMVREPLSYEYSSYGLYVAGEGTLQAEKAGSMIADLVDTKRVLEMFRRDPREQYRMFVEGKISHAEQEMLIMKDMKENELWLPW